MKTLAVFAISGGREICSNQPILLGREGWVAKFLWESEQSGSALALAQRCS